MAIREIFITYIVPCYNIQYYLQRCLNSLSSQSIADGSAIEFILVNDGSTDKTLSILQDFAAKEKRAIIVDQKNQGVSVARNAGLKVAKGKYVFFLDGDDWLTDDASQILYNVAKNGNPDIIVANAYTVNDKFGDIKKEWNSCYGLDPGQYETRDFIRKVSRLPISFKAYRRELLVNHQIEYNKFLRVGEVYAFFQKALLFSHSVAYTDQRIMNYLVRTDSVMRTVDIERDRTIIDTMHYIEENAQKHMPELCKAVSYKRSLFDIVNMFGVMNYIKKMPYTSAVGNFLRRINKDEVYKGLERYFIYNEKSLDGRKKICLLLYLLPVPVTYRLLRFRRKVKSYIES